MQWLNCEVCGREIQRNKFQIKRSKHFFCTQDCKNKFYKGISSPKHSYNKRRVGEIVGNLEIIEYTREYNRQFWVCKCKLCGTKISRRSDWLTHQIRDEKIPDCGCTKRAPNKRLGKDHPRWKGYGSLSAAHFSQIRNHAIKRGWEFNLTIEYLWELYEKQNQNCALSGVKLVLAESRKVGYDTTASLDRIDPSIGYLPGNVQWVHKDVNLMKMAFSQKDFINWCRKIVRHSNKSNPNSTESPDKLSVLPKYTKSCLANSPAELDNSKV